MRWHTSLLDSQGHMVTTSDQTTIHAAPGLRATPTGLFVDGQFRPASSGRTFPVADPATGRELTRVADAGVEDAKDALAAVAGTQPSWSQSAPRERAELLRHVHDAIIARTDEFAALITAEMGKPLAESRGEVIYGAEFFRWFAEEATRVQGRHAPMPNGDGAILTTQEPVGPCLLITPWNFPLAMGTRKIAPALAAGCTMVVKPAEQTPLTMLLLAEVLKECGVPAGVCNVLPTSDPAALTTALLESDRMRKLSFTGSTEVGRLLLGQAADKILRVSMELGGNAPFVVLGDADLDAAVDGAMIAKIRNAGQSCVAANRFLVDASVVDEFVGRFRERLASLTVGPGTEPATDVGPLIDDEARQRVHELVDDAQRAGAEVALGGTPVPGAGYCYSPTLLTNVPPSARLLREEIFGPVAPVVTFSTEEEAVTLANDTPYGLVAYLYTQSIDRARRVSKQLDTGMVGLNRGLVSDPAAPFGGVKASGLGREGGAEGISEYLETKYLALA